LADQLRHQLAFTSAIVDNLGEGVCALDRACRLTFVNPAAERLLGWAEADLLGRKWDEVVHSHGVEGCPLLDAVRTGVAYRDDNEEFARRDGSTFPVAYTATPIVADGAVTGVVVTFGDITARRRAEVERAALLARVEAALAFRTRFLSITTHELKTPLTVLMGYAQLVLLRAQRAGDDRLQRSLGTIDEQAKRMARLIDDLGDVVRIESDGLTLDPRPLDLQALLAGMVAEVAMAAPEFTLRLSADDGPVWVRGDGARLQQVLTNLLTNAVKYSAGRKEVEVVLRRDGAWAVIGVTDYGIGIPEAQQSTVFEPYVRATNALAGPTSGLGLGLFISKAIVDGHGGTLALVSEVGQGSTFSLSLPLIPADEDAPTR
jgi:PAS domain S-box-containing protein